VNRRSLVIVLHWSVVLLILMLVKGGSDLPALRWVFVSAAGLWVAMSLTGGMLGRPGPKLTGLVRSAFRPMHLALYTLLGASAAVNAAALLGYANAQAAWQTLLVLVVAGTFHAIFHLWRHTALYDGALRMTTPRIWHKYLPDYA